jgi:hypothetical protein
VRRVKTLKSLRSLISCAYACIWLWSAIAVFGFVRSRQYKFSILQISTESIVYKELVEALRYKPEGRWFVSRWCHWNFSLTYSFRPHYGPGVDSTCNSKGGRCVGLTNLPTSCADCPIALHLPLCINPYVRNKNGRNGIYANTVQSPTALLFIVHSESSRLQSHL